MMKKLTAKWLENNNACSEAVEQRWQFTTKHIECPICQREFVHPEEMYRCVGCNAFYHKVCLLAHCNDELTWLRTIVNKLRERFKTVRGYEYGDPEGFDVGMVIEEIIEEK
jgi:hypothetical protein